MFYGGGHLADNRGHCDLWRQQQKYYVKDHWGQYWGRFCCIRSMKAWKSDPACEAKYNAAKTKKKHGQSSKILCSSYIFSHPLRSLLCLLNTTCSSAQSPKTPLDFDKIFSRNRSFGPAYVKWFESC